MSKAIQVDGLSKAYRIGQFSSETISQDFQRLYARLRGKEDPFIKIGEENDRSKSGSSSIVWSLKDVSFSIDKGESVGIVGKNGAGKSTLLKLLSRVTSPTQGTIKSKGRIASLLEVGTGFHPELTGRENVFLNGAILGMKRKEILAKFDEIVAFSGVERYIDTPVKRYSSGMYVRLAFAVAAHLESEILIVDEVLAVGDAEFQRKCYEKMSQISEAEGRTILFVSHNLVSVKRLCNKGIFLDKGRTHFVGDIGDAIFEYIKPDISQGDKSIGLFDLRERKNPYGANNLIQEVRLLNDRKELTNTFQCGGNFNMEIDLENFSSIKDAKIGILIKTEEGFVLTSLNTAMSTPQNEIKRSKNETLSLLIPDFPLNRNKYIVDISIALGSKRLDYIENRIEIEVIAGDYYKNGFKLDQAKWSFCINGEWRFQ